MFTTLYNGLNQLSQVARSGVATQTYGYDDQGPSQAVSRVLCYNHG